MDNTLTTEQRDRINQVFSKYKNVLQECGESPAKKAVRKRLLNDPDFSTQFLEKCVKYLHDSKTLK